MVPLRAQSRCSITNKFEAKSPTSQKATKQQERGRVAMKCTHRARFAILLSQRSTARIRPNPHENHRNNQSARTSKIKKLLLTVNTIWTKGCLLSKNKKRTVIPSLVENLY